MRAIDLSVMNVVDGNIVIINALADELRELDVWTESDEGTRGEYVRLGGAYCPLTWDPFEHEGDYLDALESTELYIGELESRVGDLNLAAYADGESGMYVIEEVA